MLNLFLETLVVCAAATLFIAGIIIICVLWWCLGCDTEKPYWKRVAYNLGLMSYTQYFKE